MLPFCNLVMYELTTSGKNCEKSSVVSTENQCKQAAIEMSIKYKWTMNKVDRLAGCYKDASTDGIYFNQITDPDQTNPLNDDKWRREKGMERFAAICINNGKFC